MSHASQNILLILLGTMLASPAFAAFTDVTASNPNAQAILYIQEQNIAGGYADGSFHPSQFINRAEFTKMIFESSVPDDPSTTCVSAPSSTPSSYVSFTDVPSQSWFASFVRAASGKKIISGYPDGTFRPNQNIVFTEAAKIVARTWGAPAIDNANPWYQPYVQFLDQHHAIPTSITDLSQTVTRGEMAEMIWRLRANITNQPSKTYAQIGGK